MGQIRFWRDDLGRLVAAGSGLFDLNNSNQNDMGYINGPYPSGWRATLEGKDGQPRYGSGQFDTKELFNSNQNNMELKITKDKVLAAAAKCGTAKATLETLFPEAFEKEFVKIDRFETIRKNGVDAISRSSRTDCDIYIETGFELVFVKGCDLVGKSYRLDPK